MPGTQQTCRIVVLISGSGTNLQALIDELAGKTTSGQIVAAISNRPDVGGLERAARAGIATAVVNHQDFSDRDSFDAALIACIDSYQPDLVVLAGFMRILTPAFVTHFHGRLLNIHPSLLPKHKGLHTHQRALEAGDSEHGTTVHFVTAELDGGPVVIQASIPVLSEDTVASLAARVQQEEHLIYPLAMNWFIQGRLRLVDNQACLDGEPIPAGGLRLDDFETDMRVQPDA
ncbi:phosphoribosylglycinamide formyltransferase [Halopseudomonas laoshanensis]|uniref:Phosphoribosylglycinamide formyltransferase n=1 Tax=Halopseudomonas laoshanensis TaxID=2268758 RepID=A0A7V7GV09_9GAMM|nr:phosphoribosylglycinamide formyltransferase [Halopseudomonas laoshanensis]KAA0695885.1 phosphoribosylglycinamide formyltransferase [Halopseudomonas laoshanensis]